MKDLEEKWLSYLLNLDENQFFSIYRHYLGDFSHPYNKNQLAQSLLSFVKQAEVNKNLRLSLSPQESRLINILWNYRPLQSHLFWDLWTTGYQKEVVKNELKALFEKLTKRLLVFPFLENHTEYWLVSPAVDPDSWEDVLNPLQLCRGTVCPETVNQNPYNELPWVVMLLTIIEFPGKDDKTIGKKFKKRLAGKHNPVHLLIDLTDLQLIESSEDDDGQIFISVDWVEWEYLSHKTPLERALFLLTFESDCMETEVQAMAPLYDQLPRDRCFTSTELLHIFAWVVNNPKNYIAWANLIIEWIDDSELHSLASFPSSRSQARLVINPNHELIAENVDLELGLWLARCSRFVSCENVLITRLDQEVFQEYLERDGQAENLLKALERFSGQPLPQNITFTIRQWEEQYRMVTLRQGVLVQMREPLLSVFRGHQPERLAGVEDLGEGRYFFTQHAWDQFRKKTKKAAWNLPTPVKHSSKKQAYWSLFHQEKIVHVPPQSIKILPPKTEANSEAILPSGIPSELELQVQEFLNDKAPSLQREAFLKLAREGYLLSTNQFEHVWSQLTPREVSGLNFQGKYNFIAEVINKTDHILFIEYINDQNLKESYQVRPISLYKNKKVDAMLYAFNLETKSHVNLIVSKMLRVIAIKVDI